MARILTYLALLCCWTTVSYGYTFFNPFVKIVRYNFPPPFYTPNQNNYVNHLPLSAYNPYIPSFNPPLYNTENQQPSYDSHLQTLPTINILAQKPYSIEKTFTVIPMLVVPEDNLNLISNGVITSISKKKPLVTLKTNEKDTIQCTPAVRIILESPIVIYNLKTSIMFPSQMSILHEGVRIPIKVGAVIVPVGQDILVSEETPISVNAVYAIPTKPMQVDYVNNDRDVVIDEDAVIVENNEGQTTPAIEDADDESELVNRNPPSAPAGIVQSTQPIHSDLEIFQNPKESSVLMTLREESKKRL